MLTSSSVSNPEHWSLSRVMERGACARRLSGDVLPAGSTSVESIALRDIL